MKGETRYDATQQPTRDFVSKDGIVVEFLLSYIRGLTKQGRLVNSIRLFL